MTYDQYWNDDPWLVKYYREAEELRIEKRNEELWLQGMYIYEALCDVSPIMRAFAKKGTKPSKYSDAPYSITAKARRREREEKEKRVANKAKAMIEAWMSSNNKRFVDASQTQERG